MQIFNLSLTVMCLFVHLILVLFLFSSSFVLPSLFWRSCRVFSFSFYIFSFLPSTFLHSAAFYWTAPPLPGPPTLLPPSYSSSTFSYPPTTPPIALLHLPPSLPECPSHPTFLLPLPLLPSFPPSLRAANVSIFSLPRLVECWAPRAASGVREALVCLSPAGS